MNLTIPSSTDGHLTFRTLGSVVLARQRADGREEPVLRQGKLLALLAYLLSSPNRRARRHHLIDLLWADREPSSADHSFRQALWSLRQHLGASAIVSDNGYLVVAEEVPWDRDGFLEAVAAGRLDEALDWYRGPFFDQMAEPGGADFEQWADLERRRLHLMYLQAAEGLARERLTEGRYREAQQLAREMHLSNRQSQAGWRLLIQSYQAAGDVVSARAEADALEQELRRQDRTVEPATEALVALVRETPTSPGPLAGDREFVGDLVGRAPEFARILQAWDEAKAGRAKHVHIVAGAGLGKSRLLHDAYARLRSQGTRCVLIRAHPGERDIDSGFLVDLAGALGLIRGVTGVSPATAVELVTLYPPLSSVFTSVAGRTASDRPLPSRSAAIAETIETVAEDRPLTLLVDDVHWMDQVSRVVFFGALRRLEHQRVLIVTTCRPPEESLLIRPDTVTISLAPLSPTDVHDLLTSIAILPGEAWERALSVALYESTAGNPLFLLETLQLARERRLLDIEDGVWRCGEPDALVQELAQGSALQRRVKALPDPQRHLSALLAWAGAPLTDRVLAEVTGYERSVVLAVLSGLEVAGFVHHADQVWGLAHDEIATALVKGATNEEGTQARRQLGRTLVTADPANGRMRSLGIHLLQVAGDGEGALDLFVRWMRDRRARGDRGRSRALAMSFLGPAASVHEAERLVNGLPWWLRLMHTPLLSPIIAVSMLVLAGIVAAVLILPTREATRAATLIAYSKTAEGSVAGTADLFTPMEGSELEIRPNGPLVRGIRRVSGAVDLAVSPDGSKIAYTRPVATDSSTVDIFVVDQQGIEDRVTYSTAYENSPSWSPDGAAIVFKSTSDRTTVGYDLLIADLLTGEIRTLVRSKYWESYPWWSPDGTRIAFGRWLAPDTSLACVVAVDGGDGRCFPVAPPYSLLEVAGWADPSRLVVRVAHGDVSLAWLDVESGAVSVIAKDHTEGEAAYSPDWKWRVTFEQPEGLATPSWFVAAIGTHHSRVRVQFGELEPTAYHLYWWVPPSPYLDSLSIRPLPTVPTGLGLRLAVVGWDAEDNEYPVRALRWSTSESAVAVISPDGVLTALRAGMVTVRATAGGWRSATLQVEARNPTWQPVVSEDWTHGVGQRWVRFGAPTLADTMRGSGDTLGLANNGDQSFTSGVYLREPLHSDGGAGIDVWLSADIDGSGWQAARIRLSHSVDEERLGVWDHVHGLFPVHTDNVNTCDLEYPARANQTAELDRAVMHIATLSEKIELNGPHSDGRWFPVRIQVFPDGTCGVAVNGIPLYRSWFQLQFRQTARLVLDGSMWTGKVLFGPVEVWEGVRDDVDWGSLEPGESR